MLHSTAHLKCYLQKGLTPGARGGLFSVPPRLITPYGFNLPPAVSTYPLRFQRAAPKRQRRTRYWVITSTRLTLAAQVPSATAGCAGKRRGIDSRLPADAQAEPQALPQQVIFWRKTCRLADRPDRYG